MSSVIYVYHTFFFSNLISLRLTTLFFTCCLTTLEALTIWTSFMVTTLDSMKTTLLLHNFNKHFFTPHLNSINKLLSLNQTNNRTSNLLLFIKLTTTQVFFNLLTMNWHFWITYLNQTQKVNFASSKKWWKNWVSNKTFKSSESWSVTFLNKEPVFAIRNQSSFGPTKNYEQAWKGHFIIFRRTCSWT